jgi:hypothetical protein
MTHRGDDTRADTPHRRPRHGVRPGSATGNHDADHDRTHGPVRREERETREHAECGEQGMAPHEGGLGGRGRRVGAFAVVARCHAAQARHARGTPRGPNAFTVDHVAANEIGSFVTAPSRNRRTTCCCPTGELFFRTAGELKGGNRSRDQGDTTQALHRSVACSGGGWCRGGDGSSAGAFRFCSAARALVANQLTR